MKNKANTEARLTLGVMIAVVLLLSLCVTTYALFYATVKVEDNYFKTGIVSIDLNGGQPVITEDEYLFEPGMTVVKPFYIKNESTWSVYYKLYFENVEGGLADVLQIAIHPYTNTAENKYPLDTNFALGLTDKGVTTPVLYRGPDKHILNRNNCFAKRFEDKKITLYEIKLPLSSLKLNIADGQTFGLGAVVFDSDSGKRWDYYMNLYPGVTGNYSPERFGVFNFSTK